MKIYPKDITKITPKIIRHKQSGTYFDLKIFNRMIDRQFGYKFIVFINLNTDPNLLIYPSFADMDETYLSIIGVVDSTFIISFADAEHTYKFSEIKLIERFPICVFRKVTV